MKNIYAFIKYHNLKRNLTEVMIRFPVPIGIVFITFLLSVFEIRESSLFLEKSIITGVIIFFFSVGVNLLTEEIFSKKLQKHIFQGIPLLFGFIFYYFLSIDTNDFENFIYIFLTTLGFLSFVFISPFILNVFKNNIHETLYYNYFFKVGIAFLFSFIFGGLLTLLGFVGIGAVIMLFDIDFLSTDKIMQYRLVFSIVLVTPIFGLIQMPKKNILESEKFYQNNFFSFLIKYIGVPFIYLYFSILYLYTIKVLINFSHWPNGEVAWLVICFSLFGYIIYILSYSFETNNTFIKFFRKYFPGVVLPQIGMLFYAIYLRIAQYDFTINRYFVVIFGLWLLCISLYYLLSKTKTLGMIPLSLSFFIFMISFGPWGVYSFPEQRQYQRLLSNLEQANILKNGVITPLKNMNDISATLSNEIYSGIEYMCDIDNCNTIKTLFSSVIKQQEEKEKKEYEQNAIKNNLSQMDNYPGISQWTIVDIVSRYLKVYGKYSYNNETDKYINFYLSYEQNFFPLEIGGYTHIVNIYTSKDTSEKMGMYFLVDIENEVGKIMYGDNELDQVSLKEINKQISMNAPGGKQPFNSSDLIFDLSGTKYTIKLLIKERSILNPNYSIKTDENISSHYSNISGNALIGEK